MKASKKPVKWKPLKRKGPASKIIHALKKMDRDLKAGKPLKVTRVVNVGGWAIFKSGVEFPLDVQTGPFVTQGSMKHFATVRFPDWKNLEVRPVTITYCIKMNPRKAPR